MASLKDKFLSPTNPEYLIKKNYHKGIPADGFSTFARSIWEKILSNRDLDLPTQQQLLAQYRCDEIGKVVFDGFLVQTRYLKPLLDKGNVVLEFGVDSTHILNISLGYQSL